MLSQGQRQGWGAADSPDGSDGDHGDDRFLGRGSDAGSRPRTPGRRRVWRLKKDCAIQPAGTGRETFAFKVPIPCPSSRSRPGGEFQRRQPNVSINVSGRDRQGGE